MPADELVEDLTRDGRLAFDTRNPARQAWVAWTPDKPRRALTAEHGEVEERIEAAADPRTGLVDLTHRYRFAASGETIVGRSRIRFVARDRAARPGEARAGGLRLGPIVGQRHQPRADRGGAPRRLANLGAAYLFSSPASLGGDCDGWWRDRDLRPVEQAQSRCPSQAQRSRRSQGQRDILDLNALAASEPLICHVGRRG
jgi:hypothetical protein